LLPPPTGAAPPEADVTGIEVVVVVGGMVVVVVGGAVVVVVVVVVGVEGVVVLVPPAVGVEEPVPTTVRVAVGAEPPRGGDTVLPAAASCNVGAPPGDTCEAPLGGVPLVPALADPAVPPPATPGVVVLGGVPDGALGGPEDLAEISGCRVGPEPRLNPATIDKPAAATAAAAMNRLRTKYSFDAVTASGTTTGAGASGSACPNERDLKTSSKVA
jgi:hypothetical protein